MPEKNLHITITAFPHEERGKSRVLEHDLQMTKAAILYADKVKLNSMGAWAIRDSYTVANSALSDIEKIEALTLLTYGAVSNGAKVFEKLLNELCKGLQLFKRNHITLTKKERQKKLEFKKKLPQIWDSLMENTVKLNDKTGFDEINLAVNAGLVELRTFSNFELEGLAHEYLSVVKEMFSTANTHPMFDEPTRKIINLALQEGKMSVDDIVTRKSKQIGLVTDLFDRLPVFDLKMDELLDLRNELQKPLVRFRAEMIELSNNIETATWDKNFPSDVQETYQAKVEPALLEIEETLKSTTFQAFWSRRIVDKFGYLMATATASYALGASVSPLAGVASALIGAGLFAKAGLADLKEKIYETERNGLYFYFGVKKIMKQNKQFRK